MFPFRCDCRSLVQVRLLNQMSARVLASAESSRINRDNWIFHFAVLIRTDFSCSRSNNNFSRWGGKFIWLRNSQSVVKLNEFIITSPGPSTHNKRQARKYSRRFRPRPKFMWELAERRGTFKSCDLNFLWKLSIGLPRERADTTQNPSEDGRASREPIFCKRRNAFHPSNYLGNKKRWKCSGENMKMMRHWGSRRHSRKFWEINGGKWSIMERISLEHLKDSRKLLLPRARFH